MAYHAGRALDDAAGFTAARRARPPTAVGGPLLAGPEEWRGGYVGPSS